jgi:hypothetical protein
MENAVLRGTPAHPLVIGGHVLVVPHAYLTGCELSDEVFVGEMMRAAMQRYTRSLGRHANERSAARRLIVRPAWHIRGTYTRGCAP